MHDIRVAIVLIQLLSIVVCSLTYRALKSRSKAFLDFMAATIVLSMVGYGYFVFGQLWIVRWIPLPSVIILSNWLPLFFSALAAVAWLRLAPASVLRRLPACVALGLAALYSVYYFVPEEPPECENRWTRAKPPMIFPVCMQTNKYTCSAAAAATILNCLAIPATEQEMAELCLTRSGTTWLGLYHGLATKLWPQGYYVEFFEADSDSLYEMTRDAPVLLCCELDPIVAKMVPEYVNTGGWIPGLAHSVVYFGRAGDTHAIGDPSQGYEYWSTQDLNNLWTGTGLRVVRRGLPSGVTSE